MTAAPPEMRSELSAQIRLAIPLAAQQLGFQLMNAVDAALLGRYDDRALAAAGIGNSVLFAVVAVGLGVVMGLDTVLPQAVGAQREGAARRALAAGLRLAMVVGLGCTLVVLAAPALLSIADVPPDVVRDARVYIDLRAIGIVPFLLSIALRSYLAAHHITRPLIAAVAIGNLVNAGLDVVLIFGAGPLPPLGIAGAAISTVSVQLAIVAIYRAGARAIERSEMGGGDPDGSAGGAGGKAPRGIADGGPAPAPTRADVVEILRYGAPIGGHLLAEIGVFALITVLAAHLGTLPAAAHSIALGLASFTFSVAVGIGSATAVRVGHAIGAGDRRLARARGLLGLRLGLAVMAVSAAAFLIAPGAIAGLFTDSAPVIAQAVPLLQIAALFQLSDGCQAVAAGALRGIGNTRAAFAGNVLGHYGVGLAISLALGFGAGLGAPGLWWGLSAGLTVTALYLLQRFLAGTREPRSR